MQRKPGGYRQPSVAMRILSVISDENHKAWFQQIWTGLTGASTGIIPSPIRSNWRNALFACSASSATRFLIRFLGRARQLWPRCGTGGTQLDMRSMNTIYLTRGGEFKI